MPAILDLYEIPYTFSDPLVLAVCLHKGLTKTVVARSGVPTTPFVLVEKLTDVETIELPFPLFAKPVAEGTGKGITADSKINDRDSLRRSAASCCPAVGNRSWSRLSCRAANSPSASSARATRPA